MRRATWIAASTLILGIVTVATWAATRPAPQPAVIVADPATTELVERTDYKSPAEPEDGLVDDKLADKIPEFDPFREDPRSIGRWRLNLSGAVIALDVPMIRPDVEPKLGVLHPSYSSAIASAGPEATVLPSVNLIDGKAKQFDDGLMATLELASFRGFGGVLKSEPEMIERLLAKLAPESPAVPFLAAGLELAGRSIPLKASAEKSRWIASFLADETLAKPVGFHSWSPELTRAFRFRRFFQVAFRPEDQAIARDLARAIASDPGLSQDLARAWSFSAKLSNPSSHRSILDVSPSPGPISVLPSPSSRELALFARLFPDGLPPDARLIGELVARIRSGAVDLRPRDEGGWLDSQVYALETLLVPGRGDEHDRLMLTKSYKRRMLDAFQGLMTKRMETHSLLVQPTEEVPEPLTNVAPRLRLEPSPTFYLRTARSYSFLDDFLRSSIGEEGMRQIHGLREGGERQVDLWTELETMRELFYGFYLLSAEDIGMETACLDADGIDADRARQVAAKWLETALSDPDLAVDTRVSATVYVDPIRGNTRLWATLGVRLARLDASYARPPVARPEQSTGAWTAVGPGSLETSHYLIVVDEVAEVELKGLRVLTRAELRQACDRARTRPSILRELAR